MDKNLGLFLGAAIGAIIGCWLAVLIESWLEWRRVRKQKGSNHD